MSHPTEAIAIAQASSSAPAGLSAQIPPYLRESPDPSRTLELTGHGSPGPPLAIFDCRIIRLPRKGRYPQTRWGWSLLPRIFRRPQHLPLGCQLWSPECSTNVLTSLYDLAVLFLTLPASLLDSTPVISVLTTIPTPHSERLTAPLLCTHGQYSFTAALYTQCVRANMRIDTQNTPNSARSHY